MGWKDILKRDEHEDNVEEEVSVLHMLGHLVGNIYERGLNSPSMQSVASSSLELGIHLAREYPELTEELVSGLSKKRLDKGVAAAKEIVEHMDEVRRLHAEFLRDYKEGKI